MGRPRGSKSKQYKQWTYHEESEFLKDLANNIPIKDLVKKYRRSRSSIYNKIFKLRIPNTSSKQFIKKSIEEYDNFLAENPEVRRRERKNDYGITWKEVNEIRERWKTTNLTIKEISKSFGFDVRSIISNKSWYDPDYNIPIKVRRTGKVVGYYKK